ncbi:MAG: 50S ribosomal protein L13 [Eubacteriales bacterium]
MKSYMAKTGGVESKWLLIDADGQVFGRLASQVAMLLKGKHKPEYTPHIMTGDHVIVINVDKLVFTGKKLEQKMYYRHTGHPGGLKEVSYAKMMEKKPEFLFMNAVRRMLPKNKIGREMLKNLRVYVGEDHGHEAQNPVAYKPAEYREV